MARTFLFIDKRGRPRDGLGFRWSPAFRRPDQLRNPPGGGTPTETGATKVDRAVGNGRLAQARPFIGPVQGG